MRSLILALGVAMAACSPPAGDGAKSTNVQTSPVSNDALVNALTPAVSEEIGQAVSFQITTSRQDGDWGWVVAQPRKADGGAIDWAQTKYAARAEAGALDGDGTTYALLQRQNGQWAVRQFVIGPTDVAYIDWPQRYGVPAALLGLQGATTPEDK